jgi:hypothetical protein
MLSNLLRLLAAILMLAFAGGGALAQEPTASHLAAARDLIQVTGALVSVDELLPNFAEQIRKSNVSRPELTKDLEEVLTALGPELQLQRQQAANMVARTYAKFLTEPEIRETVAFFRTPVGAKYIRVQPQLVDQAVDEVTRWAEQASEYVVVRTRAEMAKRGHQLQ